jgi:hypothetical protein
MAEKAARTGWDLKRGYDAATKWTPAPDWREAAIVRSSWSARPLHGLGQTLLSGDLDAARAALAPTASEAGLWQVAEGDALVRIARDRALLATVRTLDAPTGWSPGGWAASAADDAWSVFELSGESARAVCAQATSADLEAGSPSAALLFAGITCLLYRTAPEVARIHVERGYAPYLWRWLGTVEG